MEEAIQALAHRIAKGMTRDEIHADWKASGGTNEGSFFLAFVAAELFLGYVETDCEGAW